MGNGFVSMGPHHSAIGPVQASLVLWGPTRGGRFCEAAETKSAGAGGALVLLRRAALHLRSSEAKRRHVGAISDYVPSGRGHGDGHDVHGRRYSRPHVVLVRAGRPHRTLHRAGDAALRRLVLRTRRSRPRPDPPLHRHRARDELDGRLPARVTPLAVAGRGTRRGGCLTEADRAALIVSGRSPDLITTPVLRVSRHPSASDVPRAR